MFHFCYLPDFKYACDIVYKLLRFSVPTYLSCMYTKNIVYQIDRDKLET